MHTINHERLTIERVKEMLDKHEQLQLGSEAIAAIEKCRKYLDSKMGDIGHPVYGITTGFGSLCNISIPEKELSQLQHNLVMSHACGMGEEVRPEIVKIMLLLKAQSLSYGHSGSQLCTVQRLIDMFNIFTGRRAAGGDRLHRAHRDGPARRPQVVDRPGRPGPL